MSALARRFVPLALLLALAGCGKKPDANSPLAYVPADTPYLLANLEPAPQPVLDQWSKTTQETWPATLTLYQGMLDQAEEKDAAVVKIARAVLEELSQHVSAGTTAQLGFKGSTHVALYGIGILPVARLRLSDPAALRATVARVEAKAGAKLATAKLGDLEHWTLPLEEAVVLIAIIDDQLVLSLAPAQASEALRRQLLGLTRPAKAFDSAELVALNKRYGYTPYSTGFLDVLRLVDFLGDDKNPVRSELATTFFKDDPPSMDPTCKAEVRSIAAKFPRLVLGYKELGAKSMTIHAQLELEPALAQEFAASVGSAPGTGAKAEGLFDVAMSLPVLRQKNFWLKQAKAVTEKPYACADLASLNDSFAKLKQSLDTTIPPPASDLAGLRFVLSKLDFAAGAEKPDVNGKLVVAMNNPAGAVAMAQIALPALQQLKLLPDGKPVALPAGVVPAEVPPLHLAMTDRALAVSAGAGEEAGLPALLNAPAAAEPVFMRVYFSGAMYARFGHLIDKISVLLPEQQRAEMEAQKQMFALYEKLVDFGEFSVTAKPDGISMLETVRMR